MSRNICNILVTGAAGFIGSRLVQSLLEKGYIVVGFDNLSTGTLENLTIQRQNANFSFILGDVRNKAEVKCAFKNIQVIVHLAAQIDIAASVLNPTETNEINASGTLTLLEGAAKNSIERFVFASSTAVYGDAREMPIKENTPLRPLSPYAASKAAGEAYCSAYANCYDLNTVALRFFNVYGAGKEKNSYSGVITKFIQNALRDQPLTIEGDGEQTRDFIHVANVVEAITLAIEQRNLEGEVFNVCTGKPTSINQLAEIVKDLSGKDLQIQHAPRRTGDIKDSYGDTHKSFQKLGFNATIPIETGIEMQYRSSEQAKGQ